MNKTLAATLAITLTAGMATAEAQSAADPAASTQAQSSDTTGETSVAQSINQAGVYPNLTVVNMFTASPSVGQSPGETELVSIINMGLDVDLEKMFGLKGTSLHFQEMAIPIFTNESYGPKVGDVIAGNPGPYLPMAWHLQRFTLKQTFLDGQAFVEGGKSNAGDYFAQATCDQQFACLSSTTMIQQNAGFAPPPYANWSIRAGYDLTPSLRIQGGFWQYDPAFPFTDGWQATHSDIPTGNLYLADLRYRDDPRKNLYPGTYEAMFYRNSLDQYDPLTGKRTDGNTGLFLSARKTFWRASDDPLSTSLSAFAAGITEFNNNTSNGLKATVDAGLTVQGLLPSRPFDSYGIKATWVQLTSHEQSYLEQAQLAATGQPYTVGPNEYSLTLDATFVITPYLIFQPFVSYVFNANAWNAPTSSRQPQDGINLGFTMVIPLTQVAGFAEYDYK